MMDQAISHLRRLRAVELPPRMAWAEGLLYAATIFWIFRTIVLEEVSFASLLMSSILIATQFALIVSAIRGRNYGACWWLLAFCAGWLFLGLFKIAFDSSISGWQPLDPIFPVLRLIQAALECIGLGLLFSRRGRRWFEPDGHHEGSGQSSSAW